MNKLKTKLFSVLSVFFVISATLSHAESTSEHQPIPLGETNTGKCSDLCARWSCMKYPSSWGATHVNAQCNEKATSNDWITKQVWDNKLEKCITKVIDGKEKKCTNDDH